MPPVLQLLRPHQWSKNLLLLLPMAFAHRLAEPNLWWNAALGILSFSLMASAVYVLNDALDVESDRLHPSKRNRPFAAGTLPLRRAPGIILALAGAAFGLAVLRLTPGFLGVLAGYALGNLAYSGGVKRIPGLDVLFLAGMFQLRVLAGGAATGVPVSGWLIGFSFCLFLSLALVKRAQELLALPEEQRRRETARGYRIRDLDWIRILGPVSAVGAVTVLAMYMWKGEMVATYASPRVLWICFPILAAWVLRIWRITLRGGMDADPVRFALRDPPTYLAFLVIMILVQLAYGRGP